MRESKQIFGGEKITSPPASIFNASYYLQNYEAISIPPDSRYMLSASVQAGLAGLVGASDKSKRVVDIGCGTGNPTYLFLQQFPASHITALDPSPDALKIARYKFGQMTSEDWEGFTLGLNIPQSVRQAIEARRNEASKCGDRVSFVEGRVEDMSLDADLILGVQFFHWPEDTAQALRGMRRSLKPGHHAIFDTSGNQLDWGEREFEGRKIDEIHPNGHPFHLQFIEAINELFAQKGLPPLNPKKLHPTHHKFSVEDIIKTARSIGFEPAVINPNNYFRMVDQVIQEMPSRSQIAAVYGEDCNGILIPLSSQEFKEWIVGAGRMKYFNHHPDVQVLEENEKQGLIEKAYQITEKNYGELLSVTPMESLAYFSLRAV